MGEDTFLLGYVAIFLDILHILHILVHIHSIVDRTPLISSLFFIISVLVHTYTHWNIHQTHVSYIHSRTHPEEYSTDYIRIFVMFPFSCIFLYINSILFVLLCFECSFLRVVLLRMLHLPFQI